jgi:hypothetical protein
LRFTRAWGPLVAGRGCIWFESSWKQLVLCPKKCYPPPLLATLTKWKAKCNRHGSSQQMRQISIQGYICLWDSAVWLFLEPEVAMCSISSILRFFILGVCPINESSLSAVLKY